MNLLRRHILKSASAAAALAVTTSLLGGNAFAARNTAAFSAKTLADALKGMGAESATESHDIIVKAPDIAENGAVVPVEVTSNIADTTNISILAEKNPNPLIASFNLSDGTLPFIATRIKMAKTSNVRAVVTAGDKLYTAVKEVKVTMGGCGG